MPRVKTFREMSVAVIGGAGHVGLPFAIVTANAGAKMVYGIDLDSVKCCQLNLGVMIYAEENGKTELDRALANDNLRFGVDSNGSDLRKCDVISIMIGTPVDAEGNPRLDDLFDYVDKMLIPALNYRISQDERTLVILRSTVNPGTTRLIRNKIYDKVDHPAKSPLRNYVTLTFAPERVAQGKGIVETGRFPQLVGMDPNLIYCSDSTMRISEEFVKEFFRYITFGKPPIFMTWKEAELAKLITNMYRYVNFALANEFYMIGHEHKVNVDHIINSVNKDYPRMNLPTPGPNVGGPCLFKDGKFLTSDIPYGDLINTAFIINEGFPQFLFNIIKPSIVGEKILILGATFKKDSDDIRNSLSFKFAKICRQNGYEPVFCDPNWKTKDPRNDIDFEKHINGDDIKTFVIMTPHTIFKEWINALPQLSYWGDDAFAGGEYHREILLADVWKLTDIGKKSLNGICDIHLRRPVKGEAKKNG